MRKASLLLLFCSCIFAGYTQNDTVKQQAIKRHSNIYLGIEAGGKTYEYQERKYDFIRETQSYDYYHCYGCNYTMELTNFLFSAAAKAEYRPPKSKFWASAGISYSALYSSATMGDYSQYGTDYFYVLLSQNGNESYYYRVKEINETDQYIGIPVEVRYSPFWQRFFWPYFKIGIDGNIKVATERHVEFKDKGMGGNEQAILDLFEQPENFYAMASAGVGIQLGRRNKTQFRIEADAPSVVLTQKAFAFMDYEYGAGAKACIILPINKN